MPTQTTRSGVLEHLPTGSKTTDDHYRWLDLPSWLGRALPE